MLPRIDTASSVPLYRQLVDQFKRAIASGVLREGDALPSLRELAKELRINPLTIKKAYADLEAAGLVTTLHGRGTFVAANESRLPRSARRELLNHQIETLLVDARHLGLNPDEVRQLIEKGLRTWERNQP